MSYFIGFVSHSTQIASNLFDQEMHPAFMSGLLCISLRYFLFISYFFWFFLIAPRLHLIYLTKKCRQSWRLLFLG